MGSGSGFPIRLSGLLLPSLCALFCAAPACVRDAARLYALPLTRPPTEADWARAVPLRAEAQGGRTTRPAESDVDSDAVHTATASCHHGTGVPKVVVDVRAYYTSQRLYLRFAWGDPTDDEGTVWRWDARGWGAQRAGGADGLGLLWGGDKKEFSCAHYCHLQDWRMVGPRGLADYAMGEVPGGGVLDFWTWRAGRGTKGGCADDGRLGPRGFEGDGPGSLFGPNSVRARAGAAGSFEPGDAPYWAPAGAPGATAPGELLLEAPPGRSEVRGEGVRGRGGWTVTLSRALRGLDPGDVEFVVGKDVVFGLSLFDGVAKDHNAVSAPLRLVLVDSRTFSRVEE